VNASEDRSGSNSIIAAMSGARPLFHRKQKSTRDLAMSHKCARTGHRFCLCENRLEVLNEIREAMRTDVSSASRTLPLKSSTERGCALDADDTDSADGGTAMFSGEVLRLRHVVNLEKTALPEVEIKQERNGPGSYLSVNALHRHGMARSVWTGRALQAESDDLEVIGLMLLYPALERNVCVPGHHGYPRASGLILGKA
jgi:hypothetical protein